VKRREFLRLSALIGAGLSSGGSLSAISACGQTKSGPKRKNAFVTTAGTRFQLDGEPFSIAGANNHYLGWASRREVDDLLTRAQRMGFNVLRSVMSCVIGSRDGSTKPTLWDWQSRADSANSVHDVYLLYWDSKSNTWAWNDSVVDGLGRWDYVIYRAGQLGLKLNLSLLDFWQWMGGAQQVASWFLPGYDPQSDPRVRTFFFADPAPKEVYKSWVSHVLNRKNTITGVKYRDDPTIFAWDLMNEPQIDNSAIAADGAPLAESWIREMAAHVKSIDSRHLLTTGTEGFLGRRGVIDPASQVALPGIDFASWHLYPEYLRVTLPQANELIVRHGQIAARAGRPVLVQEFGYSSLRPEQPSVYRFLLDAVASDPNSAGWLVWRLVGRVQQPPTKNFPEAEQEPLRSFAADNGDHFDVTDDPRFSPATAYQSALALIQAARRSPAVRLPGR
jgi:mannan endo-1,4-beta-mannosidase